MKRALVGSTGFVGGNLLDAVEFQACFNSANADEMRGGRFDLLVCAGLPAAKWVANRDPEQDRANVDALLRNLSAVSADRVVVVSTIDVYGSPRGVDEETSPDPIEEYGTNRLRFELAVRELFESVLVVRPPALYGPGLRKNALYDLLNDRMLSAIRPDARFQWYDVRRLWADVLRCWDAGIELANFATQPVLTEELIERDFPGFVPSRHQGEPPRYDMHTLHAERLGGQGHYIQSADEVLAGLSDFIREVRAGVLSCA